MNVSNLQIIVQAGGRGSRLRHHTWNKPKCLVSINGKPLLYYLFEYFPNADFIIIGDYAYEQLEKYLKINPPKINFKLLKTIEKGTASGISEALKLIDKEKPLLLTWSDLIINGDIDFPESQEPVVFTTSAFACRWSASEDGVLQEITSSSRGIPGLFYFHKAEYFAEPPIKGEFVKWFANNIKDFSTKQFNNIQELGDFESIEESNDRDGFCRFFNEVTIDKNIVIKKVIDAAYEDVHAKEVAWYKDAQKIGFRRIPKIYETNPLKMELIKGKHAYQQHDFSEREKRAILADYIDSLTTLHDMSNREFSKSDVEEVYINKTIHRVNSVSEMIPGFNKESMTINGKKCKNIFHEKNKDIFNEYLRILSPEKFTPIHGDPTFSNTLIDDNLRVWFIDPRGYFAKPGIYGDPYYDFAKVYYSAVGGYDNFNRRKFKLHIDEDTVEILMEKSDFSKTAIAIFENQFSDKMKQIKIIHGLIWLALSGYAKDDIDSIIASFYNGLYWLEDARI